MASLSRRQQLEAMLADDPQDVFLRYGLALALAGEGETDVAIQRLEDLIRDEPHYVPAYFQAGRILSAAGRSVAAREILARGIGVAERGGDRHAAEEMRLALEDVASDE